MSIGVEEATRVATQELERVAAESELELVLTTDSPREVEEGWVFFWTNRAWIESGDTRDALGGNGPFFVSRADGSLHRLWTSESWERQLVRFRETGSFTPS